MNNSVLSAYSEYSFALLHNIDNNLSGVNILAFCTLYFRILLNVKEKPLHQRFLHHFPKYWFRYGALPPNHRFLTRSAWLSSSLRVNAKFLHCQCNGSKHLMLRVLLTGRDSSLGTYIILKILRNINWFIINLLRKNILFLNIYYINNLFISFAICNFIYIVRNCIPTSI